VLHPHDRHILGPCLVHSAGDARDNGVAIVGMGNDVVLDVDDDKSGVGAVRQGRHGSLLVGQCRVLWIVLRRTEVRDASVMTDTVS